MAIESSDITLLGSDLDGVVTAIALARRTFRTNLQSPGWAFGYNIAPFTSPRSGCSAPSSPAPPMAFSSV